jgi:hypothetical protein
MHLRRCGSNRASCVALCSYSTWLWALGSAVPQGTCAYVCERLQLKESDVTGSRAYQAPPLRAARLGRRGREARCARGQAVAGRAGFTTGKYL